MRPTAMQPIPPRTDKGAAFPPGEHLARLARLYDRHARRVFAYCFCLLSDPEAAETVTQETFLRAHALLAAEDVPLSFLLGISTRLCRERAGRRPARPGDGFDAAMRDLPLEERAALVLRDREGLSLAETASVLGCSRPQARLRLLRARRRLLRNIGDRTRSVSEESTQP